MPPAPLFLMLLPRVHHCGNRPSMVSLASIVHPSPHGVLLSNESSSREERALFSTDIVVVLAAGDPADLSPPALMHESGGHFASSVRVLSDSGMMIVSAIIAILGAAMYISAKVETSLLLRASKQLPSAAIRASANSSASPPVMAVATLLEVVNLLPFKASFRAVEAVLII